MASHVGDSLVQSVLNRRRAKLIPEDRGARSRKGCTLLFLQTTRTAMVMGQFLGTFNAMRVHDQRTRLHTLSHFHKSRRVSNRCGFLAGAAGGFRVPRARSSGKQSALLLG